MRKCFEGLADDLRETVLWVRERFAEEFGDNNVNYMWKNLPAGIMVGISGQGLD